MTDHVRLRPRQPSFLIDADQRKDIGRIGPTDWARTIGRGNDLAVLPDNELRWLNKIAVRLPPGADGISHLPGYAPCQWEGQRQCCRQLTGLVFGIDARRNGADA